MLCYQINHSVPSSVTISITHDEQRSHSKVSLKSRAYIFPYTVIPHSRLRELFDLHTTKDDKMFKLEHLQHGHLGRDWINLVHLPSQLVRAALVSHC